VAKTNEAVHPLAASQMTTRTRLKMIRNLSKTKLKRKSESSRAWKLSVEKGSLYQWRPHLGKKYHPLKKSSRSGKTGSCSCSERRQPRIPRQLKRKMLKR